MLTKAKSGEQVLELNETVGWKCSPPVVTVYTSIMQLIVTGLSSVCLGPVGRRVINGFRQQSSKLYYIYITLRSSE